MIQITDNISISENEYEEDFIRSSGPGGQNVNKVSTSVQLRYDIKNSSLPVEVKEKLISLAGKKISGDNILIISAGRFRTQEKNRKDALDRLVSLIRKACEKPVIRKKTKPTAASVEQRLKEKNLKSDKKKQRAFFKIF